MSTVGPEGQAGWTVAPLTERGDLDAIVAIEAACFTNPWTRAMYEAEFANDGVAHFMLARSPEHQVVGFCSYWRVVDEIHINNLAVLPGYRRQGIGRALLVGIFAAAARAGATRALLEVRRSNQDAQRLYESLGFTIAGVRRGYYAHPPEDAIVLWREHLDAFVPASRTVPPGS